MSIHKSAHMSIHMALQVIRPCQNTLAPKSMAGRTGLAFWCDIYKSLHTHQYTCLYTRFYTCLDTCRKHVCTHVYTHVHTHVDIHVRPHVFTHAYIQVRTRVYTHAHMPRQMAVRTSIHKRMYMRIHMSIHMHTSIHMLGILYTCPCMPMHFSVTHVYIQVYIQVCTYVYAHVSTRVCTYVYTHVYTRVCVHACTHVCTHVHTHVDTYVHTTSFHPWQTKPHTAPPSVALFSSFPSTNNSKISREIGCVAALTMEYPRHPSPPMAEPTSLTPVVVDASKPGANPPPPFRLFRSVARLSQTFNQNKSATRPWMSFATRSYSNTPIRPPPKKKTCSGSAYKRCGEGDSIFGAV